MEIPLNCQYVLLNGIQHVGSASADLLPSQNFAHGARLNLTESTLTIFVQKAFVKMLSKIVKLPREWYFIQQFRVVRLIKLKVM